MKKALVLVAALGCSSLGFWRIRRRSGWRNRPGLCMRLWGRPTGYPARPVEQSILRGDRAIAEERRVRGGRPVRKRLYDLPEGRGYGMGSAGGGESGRRSFGFQIGGSSTDWSCW